MNANDIVIITGASSGIGKELTFAFAEKEFTVLAIGRNKETLLETQRVNPTKIQILPIDINSEQGRQTILSYIPSNTRIKFLIHNAATLGAIGNLSELSLEDLRQTFAINLEAPLFLTNLLTPYLEGGRILLVSSDLAHSGLSGLGCYCLSKAALYQLYECFKKELQEKNIAITSILPGAVDTPMQRTLRQQSTKDFPDVEKFRALKTQNKLISPKTVANFFIWVLTKTTNEEFSHKEWNIKDWLSGKISQTN
jgi:benzil reductase ((S)-benzoin forming)